MRTLPWRERWVAQDRGLCLRSNRLCTRAGVLRFFGTVSRLGDGIAWYALMLVLALAGGEAGRLAALHLAATGAVALLLYRLLKRWTRRPRPFASDVRIRAWVAPLDEFSFPSGHTLHAVAFTVVACAHLPAFALVLVPLSMAIALSRVVLGLHYPSDVLAAIGVGMVLGHASLAAWPVPLAAG